MHHQSASDHALSLVSNVWEKEHYENVELQDIMVSI